MTLSRRHHLVDWLDREVDGYEPGEEAMARSMLGRGEPTLKILNTIKKKRRAPLEWLERVSEHVGGFAPGEHDEAEIMMWCRCSVEEAAGEILNQRRNAA